MAAKVGVVRRERMRASESAREWVMLGPFRVSFHGKERERGGDYCGWR